MMKITLMQPVRNPEKCLNVAAYARISLDFEIKVHSLEAQIDYYQKKISNNPMWTFAGVFTDKGYTGTKTTRPGFQQLLEACENHEVDVILTKSISRFGRNTVDLLNTVRHLKKLGISVIFEQEGINSMTETGELMLSLLASLAQEVSRTASENSKWAVKKRFENGQVNQYILYGYKWDGEKFNIVPDEAKVVKQIYAMYLNGYSPRAIANKLNEKGIITPKAKKFYESHVWKMLREEKYTGNSLLHKCYRENYLTKKKIINHGELPMYLAEGTHPVIIKQEVWDAVQREIEVRKALGYLANKKIKVLPFSGKLVCGVCGRTYRRKQCIEKPGSAPKYKYRCGSKFESRGIKCTGKNIPETELYKITSSVLGVKDITRQSVNDQIEKIIVNQNCSLTYHMNDGRIIEKQWHYACTNSSYMEEKYGGSYKKNNSDSGNEGALYRA